MIPPDNLVANIVVIVITFAMLAKSADYLVDGAVSLAVKLAIPKMLIGIVLVGFGTTMPEFVVSVLSAVKGEPELALGNALGSIVTDTGLALALGILVAPAVIRIPAVMLRINGRLLVVASLISFALCYTGNIGRIIGITHLAMLVVYVAIVLLQEKKRRTQNKDYVEDEDEEIAEHVHPGSTTAQFLRCGVGLLGILVASRFLVDSSVNVARAMHVSEMLIGMTMVAIGTSLPEVATCISAARRGHGDLAYGDVLGANMLNLLWIIGSAATVRPILVDQSVILFSYPLMVISVLALVAVAGLKYRLEKWKGILLLVAYVAYLGLLSVRFLDS